MHTHRSPRAHIRRTLLAGLLAASPLLAQAATWVVDDFDAPLPSSTSVLVGLGERSFADLTASVPGGARDVYHHVYRSPAGGVSAVAVGNGVLASSDGIGVTSEVLVGYGAFTRPGGDPLVQGPRLGLDATPYNAFQIDFTGVAQAMNINVVLYTAAPLDLGAPLYYTSSGINVAPAVPGGPLSVLLPFAATPGFNFAQVDGVVLVLNRAIGDTTNNAFSVDRFALVSSVPEPTAPALLLVGLGAVGWLQRRRRGA